MLSVRHVVVFLVLTLLTGHAFAENRERARHRFQEATQHFDLGEYKEALAAFKDAYRDYEDPSFLFNIGQCYRQLGDKEQAIHFFRTYLNKAPDASNRDVVKETIASLDKALAGERASRSAPPAGTLSPSEPPPPAVVPSSPPAAGTTTAAPPTSERTPLYKKWWLWTVVGVVVVGAAVGAGVGVATAHPSHPTATTDFGTLSF